MLMEHIVIILCVFLIVFQQWFFMKQVQLFTDKIMSGTYGSYVQTKVYEQDAKNINAGFNVQLPQDDGPNELDALNAMLRPPL